MAIPDITSALKKGETPICTLGGIICLLSLLTIVLKVGRKTPLAFFAVICLSSTAILTRAITNIFNLVNENKGLRAILMTTCVCLIEFSLSYFVFQVADFIQKIKE